MKVTKLLEAGYKESLLGISLSRNQPLDRMPIVAENLHDKDWGHNKNLEHIAVWLDIVAPRYFWQEMATYRIGNSWQSESTVYTITKNLLTQLNFERSIPEEILSILNYKITQYKNADKDDKYNIFMEIKNILPEGFLQRRIMITNYKALRNIIVQRQHHKLAEWKYFCNTVIESLDYPELIL